LGSQVSRCIAPSCLRGTPLGHVENMLGNMPLRALRTFRFCSPAAARTDGLGTSLSPCWRAFVARQSKAAVMTMITTAMKLLVVNSDLMNDDERAAQIPNTSDDDGKKASQSEEEKVVDIDGLRVGGVIRIRRWRAPARVPRRVAAASSGVLESCGSIAARWQAAVRREQSRDGTPRFSIFARD